MGHIPLEIIPSLFHILPERSQIFTWDGEILHEENVCETSFPLKLSCSLGLFVQCCGGALHGMMEIHFLLSEKLGYLGKGFP